MVDLSAYAGKKVRLLFSLVNGPYADVSAGWYIDDVSINVVQVTNTAPYSDDFENGLGNWWADNGTWQVGEPQSGPNACYSGSQCAATVLDGNYPNTNSDLVSPSVTLPTIAADQEIHLRLWHWFSFASDPYGRGIDSGQVQIQEQTAPGVWSTATLLTRYSGTSGGVWTRPLVDLSAYAGKKVRLLFSLVNGPYADVSAGWYVDDVEVSVS